MNLKQCFFIHNACYKAAQKINVRGIVWHSTGANNPNLRRYVQPDDGLLGLNPNNNDWNQPYPDGQAVCAHAFIGKLVDGRIATYQTLPWTINGWHSGGSANDGYIGFEICEDDLSDEAYFRAVYQEAVSLSAFLCKMFRLDPLSGNTVIDHSMGATLGIASDHQDVMHWFSRYGITLAQIRSDIKSEMEGDITMAEAERLDKKIDDNVLWINNTLADMRAEYAAIKQELEAYKQEEAAKATLPCPEWAREAVQYCIDHQYIKGDSTDTPTPDTVRPMDNLTRAEMCQIIYNIHQLESAETSEPDT